jgi:site-specific DNA recombinase
MQMRRRGIEMKFVIGGDSLVSRRSDPALVKLIGRGRCWFEDLLSGRAHSMVDIGKREKVGKRYVSRVIRFAFLAPKHCRTGCGRPPAAGLHRSIVTEGSS